MEDCIFCKIAKHESPATVELENESVIAFANIAPIAQTHILIIPKKHIETFIDLDSDEMLGAMREAVQEIIKKNNLEGAYKLVFNGGRYAQVRHLHWHLLAGKLENEDDILNQT
jgi:histidine triad (HIT) family protein